MEQFYISVSVYTQEAYMREDGLRLDRMLLVTDTNYIPSGLGPVESPFQTITQTIPGGLGTTSIAYQYDALYRLTRATCGDPVVRESYPHRYHNPII